MLVNEEIEYKVLVLEKVFKQILSEMSFQEPIEQINHYYDSNDNLLLDRNIMIRVRVIDNTYRFCLKYFKDEKLLEVEKDIHTLDDINDDVEVSEFLSKLNIKQPLKYIGQLKTIRHNIITIDGTLSLDHNYYNGHEDYEIEYEVNTNSKETKEYFLAFLSKYNIEYSHSISKVKRFIQTIV